MVTLPNYEIIRVIGSGSFGFVFEAHDHNNNRKVALKRIEKVGDQLSREYEILFDIKDCDYVVKILDFYYSKTDQGKLIQNIVFEYMEDNLENKLGSYIKQRKLFSEDQVKGYIYQILKGLKYVHDKEIAHRDLKPYFIFNKVYNIRENILIDNNGKIKICDFGSSKKIDPKGKNTPYIVSRYYRAPELILCVTKYSFAIDIWAVGCILAELITREPIFQGKSEGDQLFAIFKVLGTPTQEELEEYAKKVPYDAKLFREFGNYPKQILAEKFAYIQDRNNLLDLLNQMFQYLPERRITAKDALNHPFFTNYQHL